MTKKELFEAAMGLCEKYEAPEGLCNDLRELLEPKRGGRILDINDVACFDEEGNPTYIYDSYLKMWVPVFDENGEPNFYEKPDSQLGWSRFSKAGEKARKDAEKQYKASKDAVLSDLLDGSITQEDAKALLEKAEEARKNLKAPDDLGAVEERPCE